MTKRPEIVKTEPLGDLKKHWGNELNLEISKAKRLAREGKVRIIPKNVLEFQKTKLQIKSPKRHVLKRFNQEKENITDLEIPAIIPYIPNGMVGRAYNKTMEKIDDWVIFYDHDVLLGTNPYWYDICFNAIQQIGHIGGWFSCYTNRIGCRLQKAPNVDRKTDDIKYHREYARQLYKNNFGKIKDVTKVRGSRFSGMFILTHKKAWQDAGGFSENGFFGVDVRYYTALKHAGYRVFIMQDLYVYHGYFRETLKPFFTERKQNHG